jgi:hypothetical protein
VISSVRVASHLLHLEADFLQELHRRGALLLLLHRGSLGGGLRRGAAIDAGGLLLPLGFRLSPLHLSVHAAP